MKLSEYLNQLGRGGKSAFAKAIGAYAPDLSDWSAGKRPIPARYCPAIETHSNGAVTRIECRPDDWQTYWPELAQPSTPAQEVANG
ncbi:transcriptional regulator [Comamonas fluminis]|uniref:transcriptional regulator n=1 Tax=Comamonas fluminis TaxID=2796366 RepID=UPI001C442DB3|nr:YdaS family helix-turn-helix protein [Comamonas fluminis]